MLGASNEGINCGGGAEKRDQSKPRSSSVSPEEVDDFEANVQPDSPSPRPSPNSSPPPCAEPAQSQRPQEPSLSDGARTPPPQQGQNLLGHQVGEDPSQVAERMLSASLGARAEISLDSTRGTATRDDRSRGLEASMIRQSGDQGSTGPKLSMRKVLGHSPFEAEADTFLQLALEEADEAKSVELREARKSILKAVPLDAPPLSFRSDRRISTKTTRHLDKQRSSLLPTRAAFPELGRQPNQRRKPRGTAESLYMLTKDLEAFRSNLTATGELTQGNQEEHATIPSVDTVDSWSIERLSLVKNAEKILQQDVERFRASQRREPPRRHKWGSGAKSPGRASHIGSITENDREHESQAEFAEPDHDEERGTDETSKKRPSEHQSSASTHQVAKEYRDFEDWLRYKSSGVWTYAKILLFFVMVPATGVASILFYVAGDPPCNFVTCTKADENGVFNNDYGKASASWWVLFVCCRQAVTFSMARATESFVVDYIAIRTRWPVRLLGPYVTLCVVQSKGWPCIVFFWAIFDFAMLYGDNRFANHWLFYQNAITMMNHENPSGNIPHSAGYRRFLIVCLIYSVVTALKRLYLGLTQGRRLYSRYGEDLSRVMENALLISKVGKLARDIETRRLRFENFDLKVDRYDIEDEPQEAKTAQLDPAVFLAASTRARLSELLGEWEEPDVENEAEEDPDISDIIQFRQSLSYLNSPIPFGLSFGGASTRQECVDSSESAYNRLLLSTPDQDILLFDVLAMIAVCDSGQLDEELLMKLIKLFRPDREGRLTLLDFVKSIDSVYKEQKILRASVANASKLGRAFDKLFSFFVYVFVGVIVVALLGLNPLVIIATFSGVLIGFAFMINIACSSWVQGILLILVRKPYDIGDRIHISNPWMDTSNTGSPGWIVKDVDLFTTTVVLGATNEVATYNNGSLANFRIINAARSFRAVLGFETKFPIDCPHEKIELFRTIVEEFVRARPREWSAFLAFRLACVEADKGFHLWVGRAQHRESWQASGAVNQSRADLACFALELAKKMNIRYVSPPMPIDLRTTTGFSPEPRTDAAPDDGAHRGGGPSMDDSGIQSVAQMFGTELPFWKAPPSDNNKRKPVDLLTGSDDDEGDGEGGDD